MKKTVVIHQPDFLPYLGFFHKLLNADKFVVLDDVQFLRRGWHHRDKIKTINGEAWLTVELKKSSQSSKILEIKLNDGNWKLKHINLITENYKKAEFFEEIYPYITDLYQREYKTLIDFNLRGIKILLEIFDIDIPMTYASEYSLKSKSNELLVDILCKENATHYLTGSGAKDYFIEKPFSEKDIMLIWQNFNHPSYPQLYGDFIPYLSSIDLLFNCGIHKSREIIRSC